MYCSQCGTQFEGKYCPNCGQKYENDVQGPEITSNGNNKKTKKPFYKRAWFIILAALLVIGFISRLGRGNETGASIRNQDQSAAQTISPKDEAKETATAQQTAEPTSDEAEIESDKAITATELRPEFKSAMDSYEAFMDEYVEFMKKYEDSNGTSPELIAQYATIMSKYAQFASDFEKWEEEDLNEAEMKYYIEVEARVSQKLLEVAY